MFVSHRISAVLNRICRALTVFENWRAEYECGHLKKSRKPLFFFFPSKMILFSVALVETCFWLLGNSLKILHVFYLLLLSWNTQFLLYCVSQVNVGFFKFRHPSIVGKYGVGNKNLLDNYRMLELSINCANISENHLLKNT